jgi:hypothetical protein
MQQRESTPAAENTWWEEGSARDVQPRKRSLSVGNVFRNMSDAGISTARRQGSDEQKLIQTVPAMPYEG